MVDPWWICAWSSFNLFKSLFIVHQRQESPSVRYSKGKSEGSSIYVFERAHFAVVFLSFFLFLYKGFCERRQSSKLDTATTLPVSFSILSLCSFFQLELQIPVNPSVPLPPALFMASCQTWKALFHLNRAIKYISHVFYYFAFLFLHLCIWRKRNRGTGIIFAERCETSVDGKFILKTFILLPFLWIETSVSQHHSLCNEIKWYLKSIYAWWWGVKWERDYFCWTYERVGLKPGQKVGE